MTEPTGRRVTLRDVADAAGVSVSTVSYVLNDRAGTRISDETRDRVKRAANDLGYEVNSLARAVRTGRSALIQLSLRMLEDPWSLGVIDAVRARALDQGLTTLVAPDDWYRTARRITPDVLFVDSPEVAELPQLRSLAAHGQRMVVLSEDDAIEPDGFDVVRSPAEPGAALVVDHLTRITSDIACLTSANQRRRHEQGQPSRIDAYAEAARDGRIDRSDIVEYESTDTDAFAAALSLLDRRVPRAVYCTTDFAGLMVMRAALARGIRVPDDLLVSGLGNAPAAATAAPPLTTAGPIDANERFAELTVGAAARPPSPTPHVLQWQLIARRSTLTGTESEGTDA